MWITDYRRKKLCRLLAIAAERFAAIDGPIWSSYDSGRAIAEFVVECGTAIERGTVTLEQKRGLWAIFAPTCDWDDVVGDVRLGNEIFEHIEKLYRQEIMSNQ
jgi:hypothetical protein